jgi:hypothetical protein
MRQVYLSSPLIFNIVLQGIAGSVREKSIRIGKEKTINNVIAYAENSKDFTKKILRYCEVNPGPYL